MFLRNNDKTEKNIQNLNHHDIYKLLKHYIYEKVNLDCQTDFFSQCFFVIFTIYV